MRRNDDAFAGTDDCIYIDTPTLIPMNKTTINYDDVPTSR